MARLTISHETFNVLSAGETFSKYSDHNFQFVTCNLPVLQGQANRWLGDVLRGIHANAVQECHLVLLVRGHVAAGVLECVAGSENEIWSGALKMTHRSFYFLFLLIFLNRNLPPQYLLEPMPAQPALPS